MDRDTWRALVFTQKLSRPARGGAARACGRLRRSWLARSDRFRTPILRPLAQNPGRHATMSKDCNRQ